jgi:hypothetical protein
MRGLFDYMTLRADIYLLWPIYSFFFPEIHSRSSGVSSTFANNENSLGLEAPRGPGFSFQCYQTFPRSSRSGTESFEPFGVN